MNITGKNNKVHISLTSCNAKMTIVITGDNNIINIIDSHINGNTNIIIDCNDSKLILDNISVINGLNIRNGNFAFYNKKQKNIFTKIAKGTSIESLEINNMNNESIVYIGEYCMIAPNVVIFNTDSHPIYDTITNEIVNNEPNSIIIGEHCWLAHSSTIMKNVKLASNCIVARNSHVVKSCNDEFCIVGGNPARILKRNRNFAIMDANYY